MGGLVLLTRQHEDNLALGAALEAQGITFRSLPCISLGTFRPAEHELENADRCAPFNAAAFTSRWAVAGLFAMGIRIDPWRLHRPGTLMAAVGARTADALKSQGHVADVIADPPTSADLAKRLLSHLGSGDRILLPQGDRARPELGRILESAGIRTTGLTVYGHRPVEIKPHALDFAVADVSVVVSASPSAAENLLTALPELKDRAFVAMGPTTASRLAELGANDVTVPASSNAAGLTAAVVNVCRG